jgi:hypothetical protein
MNEQQQTEQTQPAPENAAQSAEKKLQAEIAEKAEALTKREGAKVHPILFFHKGNEADPVIGYVREPNRLAKVRILDKGDQMGNYSSAVEMLEMCLLPESDSRILNPAPEYDELYLGAALACQRLITFSINQIKKN